MKRRRKAMVLVIALWAVAILVVIAMAICGTVYMAQGQLRTVRAENRDELAAQSAMSAVCTNLLADSRNLAMTANFPLTVNGIEVTLRDNKITGESGLLNANTATVEMLTQLNGMDASSAKKFIAARDKLAELRASLQSPSLANWPIANPLELTRLLGAATSLKYAAKDATAANDDDWYCAAGVSGEIAAIMRNMTLYSRQPNTDAAGRRRVNINTAATETLYERLKDTLSIEQIGAIIQSRDQSPYFNIVELFTRQYNPVINGKTVTVSIDAATFRKIADRVTVSDQTVLVGLIDVSTAPQDVLRTLPGLSEGDVTSIASWQQFKAAPADLAEQGIAALLDALPADRLAAIAPYITVRGDQYRCIFTKTSAGKLDEYTSCVIEKSGANFGTLFRYDWSVFASAGDNQ